MHSFVYCRINIVRYVLPIHICRLYEEISELLGEIILSRAVTENVINDIANSLGNWRNFSNTSNLLYNCK